MTYTKDHKTLGDIFQEIHNRFWDLEPTSLDELENAVLKAMDLVGSFLIHTTIERWNTQIRHETCPECGTKQKHKQKKRQIATWVCDVNFRRWRSYCPECKVQGEYFDDLEVWKEQRKLLKRIYMDLDGVMINTDVLATR